MSRPFSSGPRPRRARRPGRQLQPVFAMLGAGADVRISYSLGSRLQWSKPFAAGVVLPADARVVGLEDAPEFDVVVVHSPFEHWVVDVLEHLRKAGIRIVVDVDDVVDAMENLDTYRRWLDPDVVEGRNWSTVVRACEIADLVTASTPAVAARRRPRPNLRSCQPRSTELTPPLSAIVSWRSDGQGHTTSTRETSSRPLSPSPEPSRNMPTGRSQSSGRARGPRGSRTSSTSPGDRLAAFRALPVSFGGVGNRDCPVGRQPVQRREVRSQNVAVRRGSAYLSLRARRRTICDFMVSASGRSPILQSTGGDASSS